jgi:hypothetical protein
MEGNNEVDIDSQARMLDYLGREDSFTFSWGFQRTFARLRAGLTLATCAAADKEPAAAATVLGLLHNHPVIDRSLFGDSGVLWKPKHQVRRVYGGDASLRLPVGAL